MKKLISVILLLSMIFLMTGCHSEQAAEYDAVNLGRQAQTLKTLGGKFFEYEDDLYFISGTESSAEDANQVFIYDITKDKVIMQETVKDSLGVCAFCRIDEKIFFGTCGGDYGAKLYSINLEDLSAGSELCAEFSERHIYAVGADQTGSIIIGTSYPANLYRFYLESKDLELLKTDFSEQPFIRSLCVVDDTVYLGMGSQAALLKVNLDSGQIKSLIPERLDGQSFIYDLAEYQGSLIAVLNPSWCVLQYSPTEEKICDIGEAHTKGVLSDFPVEQGVGLWGAYIYKEKNGETSSYPTEYVASYFDEENHCLHGLTISGIYERIEHGKVVFSRDFLDLLDPMYAVPHEAQIYDGTLYIPWRRFLYHDLKDGTRRNYLVNTEPQASAITEDGIYTANYTEADIWFYPFSIFDDDQENIDLNDPAGFCLADIEHQCRPYQMIVTQDGKYLVVGTGPLYGQFGGAVSVYDIERHCLLYTHENIVSGHTIQSVCESNSNPGAVWLGTMPYGENTMPEYLDEPSHLILWDIQKEKIIMDLIPDEQSKKMGFLAERDGFVFCLTQSGDVFKFDARTGEYIGSLLDMSINKMSMTKDGRLIVMTRKEIFEIEKENLQCHLLADGFSSLVRMVEDPKNGDLYCFDGAELYQLIERK